MSDYGDQPHPNRISLESENAILKEKVKALLAVAETEPHTEWCKSTYCSNKVFRGYFGENDYVLPQYPVFKFDASRCDCWKKKIMGILAA